MDRYAGMGAIVGPEGVTFRVWAPNANQIYVYGSFNDWQEDQYEMNHEDKGYWSCRVSEAKEGDEYKYLIKTGEKTLHRNDPYALEVTHSEGNSVIKNLWKDWEDHNFRPSPLNELIVYELHIGTFNKTEQSGSNGDFYSAAEKLDYLKNLGINAIEVMPVSEFPGDFSWGYNPSYPFAVETSYGGPDGLKHFVFEAHMRGIAVIMDVVYNHFGPGDLDIWQFDGWEENGMGGIYFYNDHRAKTPWGNTRPDYGRPEVINYLRDNAMLWLEIYQCDGLRFDATAIIRLLDTEDTSNARALEEGNRFLKNLNGEIQSKFPHKILIAEDLRMDPNVTAPLSEGGLGFDCQWGTGFSQELRDTLTQRDDSARTLQGIERLLFDRFNDNAFEKVIFTESHDEVSNIRSTRLPEEIQPGDAEGEYAKKKSTLGAITIFTAPGVPMIFQGQEFLSYEQFNDDLPLDWGREKRFEGIVRLYRDLITLRKSNEATARGLSGQEISMLHKDDTSLVMAYSRFHGDDPNNPVLVVLNFGVETKVGYRIGVDVGGTWRVVFNSGWSGYDEVFAEVDLVDVRAEDGYQDKPYSIVVDIPSYGGLILAR